MKTSEALKLITILAAYFPGQIPKSSAEAWARGLAGEIGDPRKGYLTTDAAEAVADCAKRLEKITLAALLDAAARVKRARVRKLQALPSVLPSEESYQVTARNARHVRRALRRVAAGKIDLSEYESEVTRRMDAQTDEK